MIILLFEDMLHYMKGWKNNEKATPAQKTLWPQSGKIPQRMLGNDHEDCLRLLKEDGWDGSYVIDAPRRTAVHFFWDNQNYISPSERDIIRFSNFFHVDFYRTIIMVIKCQWEPYFAKALDWKEDELGRNMFDLLKNSVHVAKKLVKSFNLGQDNSLSCEEIYSLFEEHGNIAGKLGYDLRDFESLVGQLILMEAHFFATDSQEIDKVVSNLALEKELLNKATNHESEDFWIKKCCWLELENEISNLLFDIENKRLENANVENKWLLAYGKVYLPLIEAETRYYSLKRRIQIKLADPDITLDALDELEKETIKEELQRLQSLQEQIESAVEYDPGKFVAMEGENYTNYVRECKKIIREIFKKTHDDAVAWENFTENQKKKLREYYDEVTKINRSEIGATIRSLEILVDILASVNALYENMGIDIRTEQLVEGATLAEKIRDIEDKIHKLEEKKSTLKNKLHVLSMSKDIIEKKLSLSSEEKIEAIKKEMENRLKVYQAEIRELEIELEALFSEE